MIALWRGGAPPGMCIHELLKYKKIKCDHIAVRTSSYVGKEQKSTIDVHGLHYVIENANADDELLIVDDIFDSGRSVKAVILEIMSKMRANTPRVIRIATIYYKPKNNKTDIKPDFYCVETDKWVIFPHELEDMTDEDVYESKGEQVAKIILK